MSLAQIISRNVKALREKNGLSQQQLAERAGVSVRYLSQLENNAPNVTVDVVEKIAGALECPPLQIFQGDGEVPSPLTITLVDKALQILKSLRTQLAHRPSPS